MSFLQLILIIFRMRHCVIIFVPHLQTDSDRCLYIFIMRHIKFLYSTLQTD